MRWTNDYAVPTAGAQRNCCKWNEAEDADLGSEWLQGWSVATMAKHHMRTEGSITSRLCKIFEVEHISQLPNRRHQSALRFVPETTMGTAAGEPIRTVSSKWHTKNGRQMRLHDMDLDHMINVAHDCNFRVTKMKKQAIETLGGDRNRNVNPETFGAFRVVKPVDVFPMYAGLVERSQRMFLRQFGVALRDVRKAVYSAWEEGIPIEPSMKAAVEFVLQSKLPSGHLPARFAIYVDTFTVETPHDLSAMAWNLRIDRPKLAALLRDRSGLPYRTITGEARSAMNFEPIVGDQCDDDMAFCLR